MYFEGCGTIEELKKVYKDLAKRYHPDIGGDLETMKKVNVEYEAKFEELKNAGSWSKDKKKNEQGKKSRETAQDLIKIISKIINLEGIKIEIIGFWIWVSGETKQHKEILKEAGLVWSKGNSAWYFAPGKVNKKGYRKYMSMKEKRNKYGSKTIKDKKQKQEQQEETAIA